MNQTRTIGDAIALATQWVATSNLPFHAAFVGGSLAHADPRLPYDPASDIDCYLIVTGDPPATKIGKIIENGVLLDVSWLPWNQLEHASSHAVLASLLRFGKIVHDPHGELSRLQQDLIAHFADPATIASRINDMRTRIHNGLGVDSSHLAEPEQVMNWLFPATLATHIPLVAACAPLTVRKRFLAARNVMAPAEYESLLALYGFDDISPSQAQEWLDDTTTLFDATAAIAVRSPRFWASDIQAGARPIAIDGSQKLIDAGDHREALYWIIATRTRCLTVLHDAGIQTSPYLGAFRDMTGTLSIATAAQRSRRSAGILAWIDGYINSN